MVVEVFEDGGIGVLAVEEVLGFQIPVICVGEVAGVDHKVIIVDGTSKGGDGGVVQGGLDIGDIAFARGGIAICAIHAELGKKMGQ